MKPHKQVFTLILAFSSFCTFAQREIRINQYQCSGLIPVNMPLTIDSTDVNKKSFENKNLLLTDINFDKVFKSGQTFNADSSGTVVLPFFDWNSKTPKLDKGLQLLSFNIDADRYCKAKLSVTCTDPFEIYVNDKKEKTKETKEDSLSKAKDIQIDLTLEPRRYEIVIKRLASVSNFNQSGIKSLLTLEKKDSLSQVSISTDKKRRVTINDIMEGNRLSGSGLSPSGKYFIVSFNNVLPGGKSNSGSELREMKTNRVLYRFPSPVRPQWMPETDKIIYSRDGLKNKDLFTLDPETLEEMLLCKEIKYDSYQVSPDQSFLIISIKEDIPEEKGDLKRLLSPSDRAGSFRGRNSLYLYRLKDESSQRITFGKTETSLVDISPDSRKALIMTSREDFSQRLFSKQALLQLDLQTLETDTLINNESISDASYSPDNQKILILSNPEAFGGIGLNIKPGQTANAFDGQAFIMDLKTKDVKAISKDFNPNIERGEWSKTDNKIYFQVEDEDRRQVYVYDVRSGNYERLNLKEDMIAGFQLSKTAPVALFRGESASNAYRLYSYDLKSKTYRLLSDPFADQLAELDLSKMEDWNFTSAEGTVIKGRYYLPQGFDPAKKYPMIVYYYGGTSPTSRVFESTYPLQTYAALGYVVYTIQPSGTTGFGQEFSARHVNAWGKQTADEIIEGTKKFCEEHSFVDNSKIGCIGASYGGFMTQYLQTRTNLFAAAISHAGISSIASYWGEGYWGYSYSAIASANSYPWNNPQLYVEQSPLFHADKINTPLLLLHGGSDTNVPIGESIQMYNALKLLNKTVEFIKVEGENHAIYGYSKRIEWNKSIHAWFAKWLKNQPEWWNTLYPEKD